MKTALGWIVSALCARRHSERRNGATAGMPGQVSTIGFMHCSNLHPYLFWRGRMGRLSVSSAEWLVCVQP
jgi:hypothetical protein